MATQEELDAQVAKLQSQHDAIYGLLTQAKADAYESAQAAQLAAKQAAMAEVAEQAAREHDEAQAAVSAKAAALVQLVQEKLLPHVTDEGVHAEVSAAIQEVVNAS